MAESESQVWTAVELVTFTSPTKYRLGSCSLGWQSVLKEDISEFKTLYKLNRRTILKLSKYGEYGYTHEAIVNRWSGGVLQQECEGPGFGV